MALLAGAARQLEDVQQLVQRRQRQPLHLCARLLQVCLLEVESRPRLISTLKPTALVQSTRAGRLVFLGNDNNSEPKLIYNNSTNILQLLRRLWHYPLHHRTRLL